MVSQGCEGQVETGAAWIAMENGVLTAPVPRDVQDEARASLWTLNAAIPSPRMGSSRSGNLARMPSFVFCPPPDAVAGSHLYSSTTPPAQPYGLTLGFTQ